VCLLSHTHSLLVGKQLAGVDDAAVHVGQQRSLGHELDVRAAAPEVAGELDLALVAALLLEVGGEL